LPAQQGFPATPQSIGVHTAPEHVKPGSQVVPEQQYPTEPHPVCTHVCVYAEHIKPEPHDIPGQHGCPELPHEPVTQVPPVQVSPVSQPQVAQHAAPLSPHVVAHTPAVVQKPELHVDPAQQGEPIAPQLAASVASTGKSAGTSATTSLAGASAVTSTAPPSPADMQTPPTQTPARPRHAVPSTYGVNAHPVGVQRLDSHAFRCGGES
jgi:hypothetical protein